MYQLSEHVCSSTVMDYFPSLDRTPAYSAGPSGPTSSNPAREYYPPMNSVRTLQLLHVSSKLQTFSFPPGDPSLPQYNVKVTKSATFLDKPALAISRESGGTSQKVGEGRFEKYGPGTTIKYVESCKTQDLQLESHQLQRFMVTVDGKPSYWWQQSLRDKHVAEIVTPSNELMA